MIMKKNALTVNKGLSISQAQSISNLCNQRAREIDIKINDTNNYSKVVFLKGEKLTLVEGRAIPDNVVDLLKEKAQLHACQAFLMENIKAKDNWLNIIKASTADLSSIHLPEKPKYEIPTLTEEVDENWGWEQLTKIEISEYLEAEAFASHIGQYIHKGSTLDRLRKELPTIPSIDWITIKEGEKTPVSLIKHHTQENLLILHEKLAAIHRKYEQRVNYFKAKVKNLVTKENTIIAKNNADKQAHVDEKNNELLNKYNTDLTIKNQEATKIKLNFEKERQEKIKEISSMRIDVDPRFQKIVNTFLTDMENEGNE